MERRRRARFERDRGALGAGNMNDTKWHEVFAVLASHHGLGLRFRMKLVGSDHVSPDGWFRTVDRRWTDSFAGPFEHRDVEWLDILGERVGEIVALLRPVGRLPIAPIAGGVRLTAYEPAAAARR
jgi:hypothetical protein